MISASKKRKRLTPENVFKKPHYKSIINLLIEFQDKEFQGKKGLKLLQFRYVLEKGYKNSEQKQIESNVKQLKEFFGKRLDVLINNGFIIPESISSKQNLSKFLDHLKTPSVNLIEDFGKWPDVRYKLKSGFIKEGIRIQNKDTLNYFRREYIMDFDVNLKSCGAQHVLYGLSKEQYDKLDIENQKKIKDGLKEIERNIRKIEKIINQRGAFDNRIAHLLKSTRSKKIKKAMNERSILIQLTLYDILVASSGVWPLSYLYNVEYAKEISKSGFFVSFGWIFDVPGVKAPKKRFMIPSLFPHNPHKDDVDYFLYKSNYGDLGDLSDNEIKKYCKAWSKRFFRKDYDFSKKEIEELLEWCWTSREHFLIFPQQPIVFFRSKDYADNPLLTWDFLRLAGDPDADADYKIINDKE